MKPILIKTTEEYARMQWVLNVMVKIAENLIAEKLTSEDLAIKSRNKKKIKYLQSRMEAMQAAINAYDNI